MMSQKKQFMRLSEFATQQQMSMETAYDLADMDGFPAVEHEGIMFVLTEKLEGWMESGEGKRAMGKIAAQKYANSKMKKESK